MLIASSIPVNLTSLNWSLGGSYWLVAMALDGTMSAWDRNENLSGIFAYHFLQTDYWVSWNNALPKALITTADIAETPLPAALPLFATGLGTLGVLGWRKRRKNAASPALPVKKCDGQRERPLQGKSLRSGGRLPPQYLWAGYSVFHVRFLTGEADDV